MDKGKDGDRTKAVEKMENDNIIVDLDSMRDSENTEGPDIVEEADRIEESDNLEKTVNVRDTEREENAGDSVSAEQFDAELASLMQKEQSGKKKKKSNIKKWSKKRKILTGLAGAVVLLFIAGKIFGGGKQMAMPVQTMAMAKGDIVEKLTVNGPVSGTDSADVVSNLHAEVLQILVKEGDRVEKDQLLAVVDSEDTQKEVDIAQNAYDLAVANYNEKTREALNGYAKAQQDLAAAQRSFNRTNELYQAGGASQLELENARDAMNNAVRDVGNYTIKDGKPVADESFALAIKDAQFALEQKRKLLDNTQVKSPIKGTVVRVNSKVGQFADTLEDDKPMFIIDNLDTLEMKINISEYSIGKVKVDQEVDIRADILGKDMVKGKVTNISPTGEEKGGGSSERVIPTTIQIVDKDSKLIAGISAKAEITLAEAKDTWVVPISALIEKEDKTYIAAVEDSKIKMIEITTGVQSDVQSEIFPAEGFSFDENTQIVEAPNAAMADGMAVTAMPPIQ